MFFLANRAESVIFPAVDQDERKRIIVVDDNAHLCSFIHSYLDPRYRVTSYQDGEGCLRAVAEGALNDASLFIIDYQMANMTGIELFLALRPYLPNAKFIFMTGYLTQEMAEEGFNLGFDALIRKPFDFNVLDANVEKLLRAEMAAA
ncbi:MAG: response regulator [bacterium]